MIDANAGAWADVFAIAVSRTAKKPTGEGWKTFAQIKSERGWGENKARKWLGKCGDRLERFIGSETKRNGKQSKQNWYRPKAK